MIKAIFFDFDGTLIESINIKTEAFAELFKNYPNRVVEKIVAYHKKNGGMSRYDKFEYIYKQILKKSLSEKEKKELGETFSELVLEKILICPKVSGVGKFFEKCSKKIEMYVLSATPEEELRFILKKIGMDQYFRGAYGAPNKKEAILMNFLKETGYGLEEVLLIGDSINDFNAAKKTGILFIGREIPGEANPFPKGTKSIKDLKDLSRIFQNE